MAHLLLIESWVEGTGRLFPKAIRDLGHTYTFVTRNPDHYLDPKSEKTHPILSFAGNVLTAETNDTEGLIEFLRVQHRTLMFDGVSSICDYYVETVSEVANALNLPHPFSSRISSVRRKHKVRSALSQAGLPNPRFSVCADWPSTLEAAREIGFPLVIKPADLASSAYVRLVEDESSLLAAVEQLRKFTLNFRNQPREPIWLLEEYMTGEEVSVEAVSYKGKTTVIGITDKSLTGFPHFIEDGHMFPADLAPALAADIAEFVCRVLEAVGHDHGISHTEVKLTRDGPRLVEINPRPGGNYIVELIQRVTGIDLINTHIELSLNRDPDLSGIDHARGSAAVKFLVPEKEGILMAIKGKEHLESNTNIHRWDLKAALGQKIYPPIDNACYLGFVIAHDNIGHGARRIAEKAISELKPEIEAEKEI